jgi:hypothetical protein
MLRPSTAAGGGGGLTKPASAGTAALAAAPESARGPSNSSWSATSITSATSGSDEKFHFYQVQAQKIEQLLTNEVRRRTEGDKIIQHHVDAKVKEAVAMIEKKFAEKFVQMHLAVDNATKQLEKLQQELAIEREKNVRLTQEMKYFATKGVQDVQDAVTQEKNHRLEEECLLQKKLSEDVMRLQERLDVEKHAREQMVKAAREEISKAAKMRDKSDERALARLTDDLQRLKASFSLEVEQREKGEEQLAAAMEDVVSQVQLGLKGLVR